MHDDLHRIKETIKEELALAISSLQATLRGGHGVPKHKKDKALKRLAKLHEAAEYITGVM